jgi:hypothetical protein
VSNVLMYPLGAFTYPVMLTLIEIFPPLLHSTPTPILDSCAAAPTTL